MGTRDDFPKVTVRKLAQRAGYICAKPDCHQLTVGPSDDRKSGLTLVGAAAHITAASSQGPRYDPAISAEERTSEANGLWLCHNHAKLVDDTTSKHTVAELKRWKSQHEDWIFARVASADGLTKHGLTGITIENVGPFRERTTLSLGRHNVIFGRNVSGKSTVCECIAAFSGGTNLEHFRTRWDLFGTNTQPMAIEAGVSVHGAHTTVRLSEEAIALKRSLKRRSYRLHIEVNGSISPNWPRSLFNIIYLDKERLQPNLKDDFRRHIRELARQLTISEDQLWDNLREELFCSSQFGSRIRRIGEYRAEVKPIGSDDFYAANGISGAELTFAIFDVMLRMIRIDPRPTPWIIIVDSSMFLGLDNSNKRRLVNALNSLKEPTVQTIVCVNSEKQATDLTSAYADQWAGSGTAGDLTIHSFL